MDYYELMSPIIDVLIAKEHKFDIVELLFRNKCYYLLNNMSLSDDQQKRLDMILAINEYDYKMKQSKIFGVLRDINNIDYAIVKGAALSKKIYGDFRMRSSLDVDILVSPHDLNQIKKVLLNNGFIQGYSQGTLLVPYKRDGKVFYVSNTHQLAPFIKETNNKLCPFVCVDVNFSVFWGEEKQGEVISIFLKDLLEDCIDGQRFKRLSPEMEFIHLCLHHYKDLNSLYLIYKGNINIGLFSDIFFYVLNTDLDWEKLKKISEKINVSKYIYYCLYFCSKVFFHNKLNMLLKYFSYAKSNEILQNYGLTKGERKKWETEFYNRLLDEEFSDKFIVSLDDNNIRKIKYNEKFLAKGVKQHEIQKKKLE